MSAVCIGDRIDQRFLVEEFAGAGGMGSVYRARDERSGTLVALKVLNHAAPSIVDRFVREAEVLATLDHPAIVRYVAHGVTQGGAFYIAMEWLEGEDLAQRLRRGGLTCTEAVVLATRLAGALAHSHGRGIVHRDIKPSNIFLARGSADSAKLLDFGIARVPDAHATKTGMLLGTPGYMAPEQVRGERGIDARADVFAFGCVLFECLSGRRAFEGEQMMAVLGAAGCSSRRCAPGARAVAPHVPAALAALVSRER